MSFSSFLPPPHILQYPLLEEWIFDFVLLGADDTFFDKRRVALVRVLVGNFLSGASTQDPNLKGFSIIEIFRNEIFRKDKKSYSECQKITRVFSL